MVPFQPRFKALAPLLGRNFALTSEKAPRILGFSPCPATPTVIDCAAAYLDETADQVGENEAGCLSPGTPG
jgi:dihydroflavonol-4-reductase